MAQITIQVSDTVQKKLKWLAKMNRFRSLKGYAEYLLLNGMMNAELEHHRPRGFPSIRTPEELDQLILERVNDDEGSFEPDASFYKWLRDIAKHGTAAVKRPDFGKLAAKLKAETKERRR